MSEEINKIIYLGCVIIILILFCLVFYFINTPTNTLQEIPECDIKGIKNTNHLKSTTIVSNGLWQSGGVNEPEYCKITTTDLHNALVDEFGEGWKFRIDQEWNIAGKEYDQGYEDGYNVGISEAN